jgi:alpha-tubulin suppressor-like RCC1 family protein
MRVPVARLALAALLSIVLAACNDTPDRLLAPSAAPSRVIVINPPPPAVGPCNPAFVICAMTLNVDVSTGNGVTCSVRASGAAFCWGDNYQGMLGAGVYLLPETCTPYRTTQAHPCATKPLAVAGGKAFTAISVGADHVCAIEKGTGAGYCWGAAQFGQLGSAQTVPFLTTPTAVAIPSDDTIPLSFTSISAGGSSTCGITNRSLEYCWGTGFSPSTPVRQNRNPIVSFRSVSTGETSQCAIDVSGNSCKGFNHPYAFIGQATTASHYCQISNSGITECWGSNSDGQLGNSTTGGTTTQPTTVSGTVQFQFVSTGATHTCALSGGAAFCWGSNRFYQMGIGSTSGGSNIPEAVAVPSGNPQYTKIAAGGGHTCALDRLGGVWCWGLDDVGQIGNGGSITVTDPNVPANWAGIAQPVHAANPLQ